MAKTLVPHMPLWVYDIDTDRDCRRMGDAEFGRYMRLLIRQWIEGSVPNNPSDAIKDAGLDLDAEAQTKSLLERKFSVEFDGGICNPRCHEERERILQKLKTLRKNGRKGGRPRGEPEGKPSGKPNGYPDGKPDGYPNGSVRAYVSDSVSVSRKKLKGGLGENVPPPDGSSPEFASAWSDWQQHRRETGKPLTATAARQQLAKLSEMNDEARAVKAMRHSMANGWQGIFEEKHNDNTTGSGGNHRGKAGSPADARRADRLAGMFEPTGNTLPIIVPRKSWRAGAVNGAAVPDPAPAAGISNPVDEGNGH